MHHRNLSGTACRRAALLLNALVLTGLVLSTLGMAAAAHAQSAAAAYPSKPVRIIVPYSAGGFADTGVRAIAEALAARLGQQVVIDNRPGAAGAIGVVAVAQAAPDGHTLLLGFDGTLVIYPHMAAKLPFDTVKDLAAVTKLGDSGMLLVAHPSVPAKNLAEFIALNKAQPKPYPYGTSGNGSTPHLAGELLKGRTGVAMEHVAYKGGGQAIVDVLGGQIPLVFTAVATAQQYVKSGKLIGLGITSEKRVATLPEVPTFIESGLPNFIVNGWIGILAPQATPKPIIDKLQREIAAVLQMPAIRERYAVIGIEPVGNTPEQFAEQIKADLLMWGPVVKAAQIKLD